MVTPHTSYNIVIDTIIVAARIDIIRYEFGVIGLFFMIFDEVFMMALYAPCPPVTSNHAWSTDFSRWCPVFSGIDSTNCDDRGTKNHIMHDA